MDLNALHSLMSKKKFHYFEGQTNDKKSSLYLSFSTLYNGRGNSVDIRIGDISNDIECWIDPTYIKKKNVSDDEVFSLIKTRC